VVGVKVNGWFCENDLHWIPVASRPNMNKRNGKTLILVASNIPATTTPLVVLASYLAQILADFHNP
jgi:hypothetical protein